MAAFGEQTEPGSWPPRSVCRSAADLRRFLLCLPAPASGAAEGAGGIPASWGSTVGAGGRTWNRVLFLLSQSVTILETHADPAPLWVACPGAHVGFWSGGAEAVFCGSYLSPCSSSTAASSNRDRVPKTHASCPRPALLWYLWLLLGCRKQGLGPGKGLARGFSHPHGFPSLSPGAAGSSSAQLAAVAAPPLIKLWSGLFSEHMPLVIPANLSWSTDPGD